MRTHLVPLLAVPLLLAATGGVTAGEFRDRVTADSLRQQRAAAGSPLGAGAAEVRDARAKTPVEQSLLRDSTILSDGRCWTMVPAGSVLHVPAKLQQHVNTQPAGTLVTWLQFLTCNRAWLSAEEVDMDTAAGRKPVTEEAAAAWQRRNSVVVAVHRGGAISVRKPNHEQS